MGLDRTIRFPAGETPSWEAIRDQLRRVGEDPPVRMIDGLPAFPDEAPDPGWRELRLGTPAGMLTLRRAAGSLTCVIWGNADAALMAAQNRLCWACAVAGEGSIETPSGLVSAADFAASADIRPA
jgi:hypothetical protein